MNSLGENNKEHFSEVLQPFAAKNPRTQTCHSWFILPQDLYYGCLDTKKKHLALPGKHRKVHFFKATVAGFRGKIDGNKQQLVFQVGKKSALNQKKILFHLSFLGIQNWETGSYTKAFWSSRKFHHGFPAWMACIQLNRNESTRCLPS